MKKKNSFNALIFEMFGIEINCDILSLGFLEDIRHGTLSYLEDVRYIKVLNKNTSIVAVFIKKEMLNEIKETVIPIVVEKPKAAFFDIHNEYCKRFLKFPASRISKSAHIAPNAFIAPRGVKIGENVKVYSQASILEGTEIGDNCSIGPGCVVGCEGIHVYEDLNGIKQIAVHDGIAKICKGVHVEANSVVLKGLMGRDTIIEDEAKIGPLALVGHGVRIGKRSLVVGNVCLCGSAQVGNDVWIGPQSVVSHGLIISDRARVLMGSVVISNVKSDAVVSGNFAGPHEKNLLSTAQRF